MKRKKEKRELILWKKQECEWRHNTISYSQGKRENSSKDAGFWKTQNLPNFALDFNGIIIPKEKKKKRFKKFGGLSG